MIGSGTSRRFPTGFLWGAATSAYQIEGATTEDGRGVSIWDTFSRQPGAIADGTTGDVADDHYHRYPEDVALMRDLGLDMYRFSVAWPRIQPDGRGLINQRGLDFYRRLVDELLSNGIRPNLTLYHWDLPQPLQDAGGWSERDTALRFADYASIVYRELHDRVGWWATLNEPWCASFLSYAGGIHAPGIREPRQSIRAAHHLLLGHGLAVRNLQAIDPGPRLGIALNPAPVRADTSTPDAAMTKAIQLTDGYRNRLWMEPLFCGQYPADMTQLAERYGGFPVEPGDLDLIKGRLDWLGINYYNDTVLTADPSAIGDGIHPGVTGIRNADPEGDLTDLSWPITPDGMGDLLVSLGRDYPDVPPIMITENGAAYDDPIEADGTIDDARRIRYLRAHLGAVTEAIAAGADVRGYLIWSLLDNFEWSEGYSQRFGLVHVDHETQVRTPRRSADWYRQVIERNALPTVDAVERTDLGAAG